MGLKSLPILNKSGVSVYWSNIWDSIKLYKKYSFSFYYVNDIIYYFISDNAYYYVIDKIRLKGPNYKINDNRTRIDEGRINPLLSTRNFYLGKILIFNNQGWVLILINYFITRRYKVLPRFENVILFKKLLKSFKKNELKRRCKIDTYKFIF